MNAPAGREKRRVAAVDVDGTLTRRDCVVPFLRRVGGTVGLAARLLARPDKLLRPVAQRDRDALKELASFCTFRGKLVTEVDKLAETFARTVAQSWVRPDTRRTLDAHLENGDVVVLVSASFEVYLLPFAEIIGVHNVLATRLDVGSDNQYSGRLEGSNCRGPEKVARLHQWLDQHHGGRDAVHLSAYGDSAGDRELLLDADEAHWLGSGTPPVWFPT